MTKLRQTSRMKLDKLLLPLDSAERLDALEELDKRDSCIDGVLFVPVDSRSSLIIREPQAFAFRAAVWFLTELKGLVGN